MSLAGKPPIDGVRIDDFQSSVSLKRSFLSLLPHDPTKSACPWDPLDLAPLLDPADKPRDVGMGKDFFYQF